ncbi:MAG: HDOD domain-containing protein [Candidatus Binatia bacterium]
MSGATAAPKPEVLRRQLSRLKTIPTLPGFLDRVVTALDDPEIDFDHVADLIEIDQALTSQILRLANSAFYSAQGTVSRVSQALLMLGCVVTRSLVLSTGVLDIRKVALKGFWEHSLGCAVAAGAISKVTKKGSPEEVTAAGLLHDLGKVVLCKELPEAFELITTKASDERRAFREVEREVLTVDHCDIAAWLVEKWRFPPCLAEPIVFHHTPTYARRAADETAIVHVANVLVRALNYGCGGDPRIPAIEPRAWQRLGLTGMLLDDVLEQYEADLDHALNYAFFD